MLQKAKQPEHPSELAIALEAAKRATDAALHGPPHLRSGQYNPTPPTNQQSDNANERKPKQAD